MKYTIQKTRIKSLQIKPIPRVVVPSFFTLMNLLCGFISIIMVAEGKLVTGAWLFVLAGMLDVLDGFMARLANATGDFGRELGSICDVVSVGVAPGFLLYHFAFLCLQLVRLLLATMAPF